MAVFTVLNVPDGIKKQFKDACERNKISMAKVVINLMVEYVVDNTDGVPIQDE